MKELALHIMDIMQNSITAGSSRISVRVKTRDYDRLLEIIVEDDGCGMDERTLTKMNERLQKSGRAFGARESEARGGIALVNVNNRIHLLYGEEYGLHVFSMPGLGTDVEITLPAITSDREVKNKEALK